MKANLQDSWFKGRRYRRQSQKRVALLYVDVLPHLSLTAAAYALRGCRKTFLLCDYIESGCSSWCVILGNIVSTRGLLRQPLNDEVLRAN